MDWKKFLKFNKRKLLFSLFPLISFFMLIIIVGILLPTHQGSIIAEILKWFFFWPSLILGKIASRPPFIDILETIGIIPNALYFYLFGCWLYSKINRKGK